MPESGSFDPRSLELAVGGQAVMEGVMMRCPTAIATAVRTPAGSIVVRKKPYEGLVRRWKALNVPLIRGGINLIETMSLGVGSLLFSAEQAMQEDVIESEQKRSWKDSLMLGGTLVFSFALSIGLFFFLPLILTELTGVKSGVGFNLIDGALRLIVFLAYLLLVSRLADMRRLFQYHGAEHKTIHTFENGLELTVDNAKRFPTLHPRCGTSFLFFVMVVSIVVFVGLGRPETLGDRLLRLAFVPVIGGIAYEVIRLSGKFYSKAWMKPFIWPGLMLQKITTKEPEDEQLEVALTALKAVLDSQASESSERTYYELFQNAAA